MAPKSSFLSQQQPSKEEEEREEESSSGEEEKGDESDDQENSSDAETEEASSNSEGVNQETLNNSKSPIPAPKFESKFDSDRDSEGSPSGYMLQPIHKSSVSSSKRSRVESKEILDSLKSCKSSRIDENKHASSTQGTGAGCINRLWSNDDEIAMLNGMIEFKTVKGLDPNADMGAFHSFIKGKFKVDFTRDQLKNKITRMKKRFLNALKKGENGSGPVFTKPHEVMTFEISKKIWGGSVVDSNDNVKKDIQKKKEIQKVKKDGVDKREVVKKEYDGEGGDFWSKYPHFNASFDDMKGNFPSLIPPVAGMSLVKERLSLIGNAKAKELDDKWKQLRVEQTKLSYKFLVLMKEQIQMTLDQ